MTDPINPATREQMERWLQKTVQSAVEVSNWLAQATGQETTQYLLVAVPANPDVDTYQDTVDTLVAAGIDWSDDLGAFVLGGERDGG